MKTRMIELKIVDADNNEKMIYADWLKQVLSRPLNPQAGMTLEEQRKLLPIFDIIDPPGVDIKPAKVYLTEEQWVIVKARLNAFPFPALNRLFVAFADDIEGAEEVEMEPREEAS